VLTCFSEGSLQFHRAKEGPLCAQHLLQHTQYSHTVEATLASHPVVSKWQEWAKSFTFAVLTLMPDSLEECQGTPAQGFFFFLNLP